MTATEDAAEVFFALAETNRVAIAELLSHRGPMSAGSISANFAISAPAISQHLRVLRHAGVVTFEKRGQVRLYRLNPERIEEATGWLSGLRRRLQDRYDTLERLIQNQDTEGDDGETDGAR